MRLRWIAAPIALCLMLCALLPVAASAATAPTLVGSVSDPVNLSGATSVAISGNDAYTTAYYAGELTAVDISNPAHPVIAGHSAMASNVLNATTVALSGGYAYVVSKNANASHASADNGTGNALSIFDIHTNPASPVLVGTVRDPVKLFGAYGIAIQGNYAYVAAQGCIGGSQPCPTPAPGNDFVVIDISNPANPTIVATVANPTTAPFIDALSHADSVSISGNIAYVTASYSDSLTAISIANPLAPAIVGSVADSQVLTSANDVAVQGNDAYVADETGPPGRFTVMDVSDPAHMRTIGSVTDPSLTFAYRVRVHGNDAFVSSSMENSVTIIDISDPTNPTIVGRLIDAAHLSRTTGLDFALSGPYLVTSSPYMANESQTDYPPYPLQAGGPAATGSISVINLNGGSGPVVGQLAPAVSGLRESAHKWREHGSKHARHKPPRGTKFTFTLNQSATVTLTFVQTAKGRLSGGRCQAPKRSNRHHRSCVRTLVFGKFTVQGHIGTNTVAFAGRAGRKLLKPGRYTLVLTATANGLTSAGHKISFTIVAS